MRLKNQSVSLIYAKSLKNQYNALFSATQKTSNYFGVFNRAVFFIKFF